VARRPAIDAECSGSSILSMAQGIFCRAPGEYGRFTSPLIHQQRPRPRVVLLPSLISSAFGVGRCLIQASTQA